MSLLPAVLRALDRALQLQGRALQFDQQTLLLGALPELDSMSAVALIGELEAEFGITFDDQALRAEAFTSVGTLCELVAQQLG